MTSRPKADPASRAGRRAPGTTARTTSGRTRAPRWGRASVAFPAALLCVLAACRATPPEGDAVEDLPTPWLLSGGEGVDPLFLPALEALQDAVVAGDDEVAGRILARVEARGPEGRAAELCAGFRRILDGRALVRALDLRLVEEPRADGGAERRITLVLSARLEEPLALRPGPARLRESLTTIAPDGSEHRAVASRPLDPLGTLRLAPGEVARVPLAIASVSVPPGALALRARYGLELLSGRFERAAGDLPAQGVRVAPLELCLLADFLPTGPVEPAELERYVREGPVHAPPLIERAVRVAPERRGEALDRLAPLVLQLPLPRLERVAPALRWLSGSASEGGDPDAWRAWARARLARSSEEQAAAPAAERDALELPRPR